MLKLVQKEVSFQIKCFNNIYYIGGSSLQNVISSFNSYRYYSKRPSKGELITTDLGVGKSTLTQFFWKQRLFLILKNKCQKGWQTEALFYYRKNNTQFLLLSPQGIHSIFKRFSISHVSFTTEHLKLKSKILCSITVGQLGFTRNKKKVKIAAQSVIMYGFWLLKLYQQVCCPVLFKTKGLARMTKLHLNYVTSFVKANWKGSSVYALMDVAPMGFGMRRLKHAARKRYRQHIATEFSLFYDERSMFSREEELKNRVSGVDIELDADDEELA